MTDSDRLTKFRDEVRRWNDSINLVSRHDTAARIDTLANQCTGALRTWGSHPGPLGVTLSGRHVLYIDLGSGGGFPAAMWHEVLARECSSLHSVLVEPREKRAWFLARIARLLSEPAPEVLAGRWGEVPSRAVSSAELVIVSLKALRLTDVEILAGLGPFLAANAQAELAVARFHPEDQKWSDNLVSTLEIPDPSTEVESAEWRAVATASGLVRTPGSSLVVSRYRFSRL
ncbi:MAG: hypothetical protein GY838_10225 [bacterium]|nr:hypothetical protein [bacterium]